jgi:putative ABC transport system permease protein
LNLKPGADRAAADAQIKAIASDFPQFNIISGTAYFDSIKTMMQAVFAAMYFLFAFLAFPSLIAMLNTLAIGVIERTREIGMIRAVGATRGQIGTMVVAEALLLAAIGTVFGLAGGLYLGYTFVSAIQFIFPSGYAFPVAGIIGAVAFGLIFGALAAVIPARQVRAWYHRGVALRVDAHFHEEHEGHGKNFAYPLRVLRGLFFARHIKIREES